MAHARGVRRATFVAVVAAVALMHAGIVNEVAASLAEAESAQSMPARIEVAYVRTLEREAPKAAALPPAVPVRDELRAAHSPRVPRRVAKAASAAEPNPPGTSMADAAARAASEPERPVASASDAGPVLAGSTSAAAILSASASASAAGTSSATEVAAAAAAASAAPGDAFAWPSATKVSYILNGNYRGEVNGRAEVEWIRVGERYQVNVDLRAGPEFAPIFSRKMTSEGTITIDGLVPDRYDEDTQVLFRDRRRMTVLFEPESITLGNGQKRERMPGVQDTASQFIQFTWLFGSRPDVLKVGNTFEFPLALPRSMNRWTYDVTDEETLYTPFGELPAFHLKPRLSARKAGDLTAEIWFAPELRFLPVRIRIEQDPGTFIDLMISKKPEIAA